MGPTGVATQDPGRQSGLVVEDKAERVRRFQAATVSALWDISCAMGLDDPWAIRPHHLHERLNSARSDSIDRIYTFYERGVLLDDPQSVASARSEEHTSELQSLMRISYAVFCLKKKTKKRNTSTTQISRKTK